jgi:hypothetical protein
LAVGCDLPFLHFCDIINIEVIWNLEMREFNQVAHLMIGLVLKVLAGCSISVMAAAMITHTLLLKNPRAKVYWTDWYTKKIKWLNRKMIS